MPVDLDLATHLASELEGHPDNASASVLGGLTVSWMPDGTGLDRGERTVTARIDPHPDVEVVVFVPETQLATRTARAVLPATVPLAAAAAGAGRAALLVHALTADPSHLHAATRDWLHQEARRPSYPATMELVDLLALAGPRGRRVRGRPERPRPHDARGRRRRAGRAPRRPLGAAHARRCRRTAPRCTLAERATSATSLTRAGGPRVVS